MLCVYESLDAILEFYMGEVDDLLAAVEDDELHNLVNESAKRAGQARARIAAIEAAGARP